MNFRTTRVFDYDYEYKNVLNCIDRVRKSCKTFVIRESLSGHPTEAFDAMKLDDENGNSNYISDDNLICFDSANYLLNINENLTGKYGWHGIADVVETRSGIGMHDWHWTLNSYVLKSEYAQMLIDELDKLYKEVADNYDTFIAKENEMKISEEKRLQAIKDKVMDVSTERKTVSDEGGKTYEYIHTISFPDGEVLKFSERNVFDFGVVINPKYIISNGIKEGGLCINDNGVNFWQQFGNEGWFTVRELTANEVSALGWIRVFGGFANAGIRM